MTADADRALRRAALGFAFATGFTTAVAIREDLPGEPLGLRVPLSVPTGILVGWGDRGGGTLADARSRAGGHTPPR